MSEENIMYCYVVEIGDCHEDADTTRVFSTLKKALDSLPEGFEQYLDKDVEFSATNKKTHRWFIIKKYKIE